LKVIHYTRSKCIGCGICTTEAPNIFVLNKNDAKADLLDMVIANDHGKRILWPDELHLMQSIVKLCSVKAIKII